MKASEKTFLISHIHDIVFGVTVHSIKLYFTLIPESIGESRWNNSQIHCSWSKLLFRSSMGTSTPIVMLVFHQVLVTQVRISFYLSFILELQKKLQWMTPSPSCFFTKNTHSIKIMLLCRGGLSYRLYRNSLF